MKSCNTIENQKLSYQGNLLKSCGSLAQRITTALFYTIHMTM